MDLIQLYSATQRVVKSLKTSGLMPALKSYRVSLRGKSLGGGRGDRATHESVLMEAAKAYIDKTAMYGEDEVSVVNLLHLTELSNASYWQEMTTNARSLESRQAQAMSAFSKVMFATGHLPGLLSLVRETSAVDGLRTDEHDSGALVLRLYDGDESASSPDRMARLIDSIDMLYAACSAMSGAAADSLRLMSVTGVAVRSVVFHGEVQSIGAVRKVIGQLNDVVAELPPGEEYSVEAIVSGMPLLEALHELERLDVITAAVAASADRDAQSGAIMVLDCGVQLVNHDIATESAYIPASVIARLDADGKSFDTIDTHIGESIDARYDEVYEREKQKLLNESSEQLAPPPVDDGAIDTNTTSARGERSSSKSVGSALPAGKRKENIDELIIDLNRLYGEQR